MNYYQKWQLWRALERFPPGFRPIVIDKFVEALQEPDSLRKKGIFMSTFKSMEEIIQSEATKQKERTEEQFQLEARAIQEKLLAPTVTFPTPRIDFLVLEEKALAKRSISDKKTSAVECVEEIKNNLAAYPDGSRNDNVTIYFLLSLSLFGNFFFLQSMLGDFVYGSTYISLFGTLLLSVLLVIAEVVGPKFIFSALPEKNAIAIARCTSILGGLMLVIGILLLFLGRGELANTIGASAGDGFIK